VSPHSKTSPVLVWSLAACLALQWLCSRCLFSLSTPTRPCSVLRFTPFWLFSPTIHVFDAFFCCALLFLLLLKSFFSSPCLLGQLGGDATVGDYRNLDRYCLANTATPRKQRTRNVHTLGQSGSGTIVCVRQTTEKRWKLLSLWILFSSPSQRHCLWGAHYPPRSCPTDMRWRNKNPFLCFQLLQTDHTYQQLHRRETLHANQAHHRHKRKKETPSSPEKSPPNNFPARNLIPENKTAHFFLEIKKDGRWLAG